MGKRNWGQIAKWTAVGTFGTVVVACEGLDYANKQDQAQATQVVTTAMNQLVQKPVTLIDMTDDCMDKVNGKSCKDLAASALNNAGSARFDGAYYAADYDYSAHSAFKACARNHGWSQCVLATDGAFSRKLPSVIVPADTKDKTKAQLIWMLPGYEKANVGMAADGKKYHLDLQ